MALCRPENQDRLGEWAKALVEALSIPVIFKIGYTGLAETRSAIETMAHAGVPIVHMSIGTCHAGSEGLGALGKLAALCDFLIAGGGVRNAEDARRVLDAGAGAVAIASAAMNDPTLCGRIQGRLRA